ncbi:hypothetical protein D3C77_38050 [compost metagenome]
MKFLKEFFAKPLEEPPPPPVKDSKVSEPIISFVRAVKDNPKRFKVSVTRPRSYGVIPLYIFTDKELGKKWDFCIEYDYYGGGYYIGLPSWITREESTYLYKELSHIWGKQRREKLHNIQRERMKRVYN